MGFEYPKAGLGNVASYQVSGVPFVTGALTAPANTNTPLEIVFPSVTKRVIVHNIDTGDGCRVAFSSNGAKNSNYFLADPQHSNKTSHMFDMNVKCTKIYILSNTTSVLTNKIYVAAELTGIQPGFDLAASYSGSSGIG